MRRVAFATAAVGLALFAATAEAKTARCVLKSGGDSYRGPCAFTPEAGGTFTLSAVKKGARLIGEVTDVTVYVIEPGTAEVSGLVKGGNNSRWGAATRSTKDRACWMGEDFSVCAY